MILTGTAPDAASVTPGIAGFLTFFALAVIVVLLVLNMSKHLRRIDARAAQEEAAEAVARAAAEESAESAEASGDPEHLGATEQLANSREPREPEK